MLRVLRITLMWLVAFAVPVQGYAAATMFGCGPGHHDAAGVQLEAGHHDAAVPQHSHEEHAELASGHPHHDSAEPNHAHLLKANTASSKVAKGPSTPCSSCCVVAALPATLLVFQPIPLVDFFTLLAPRGPALFLTEGPERPPRSSLV